MEYSPRGPACPVVWEGASVRGLPIPLASIVHRGRSVSVFLAQLRDFIFDKLVRSVVHFTKLNDGNKRG